MIELKNVSFSYNGRNDESLSNINLKIENGECILFCGRSGCGKTTITRLINGLIPNFYYGKLTGDVLIDGENISGIPMYKIAEKVGCVFQNPRTQFFNVDTDSEIAFGIENRAYPLKELVTCVKQTIKDLHIENLSNRNIFELSGGEKQKIAFASVYAMNPDIYVLDEPSSNLDMQSINDLKKHIMFIKQQGKTILIAEHRLYYLIDVVDRIVYLEQGRIDKIYEPKELQAIPDKLRHQRGLRSVDLNNEIIMRNISDEKETLLELKDISLFYKNKIIVENINISVAQGDIIAIVGHNGVGKTTFSRTLCGLHKEYTGRFLWKKKNLNNKGRIRISYMVMQDVNYQLFAESVESEVSFGIKNSNQELVYKTMKELDLLPFKDHHPNTLSGGQKQRLAVAVSITSKKDLLIFDEPTSGLDYDSMMKVTNLINTLSKLGKIIFVVTHDYEFACKICSRILYIDNKKQCNVLDMSTENKEKLQKIFFEY